jgi:glycine cleavage system H protein
MITEVNQDSKYLRTGEWARVDGNKIVCGISKHAEIIRNECVYVELPQLGWEFKVGESYGVIESVNGVTDVYAPVSGAVIAVNNLLQSSPTVINEDPYGKGWIIQLEPHDASEIERLLDAEAYMNWLAEVEASRIKWIQRKAHSPEYMIGMIIGGHRVAAIIGMGAEGVVFDLQSVETGEIDRVLKVSSSEFRPSWWWNETNKAAE